MAHLPHVPLRADCGVQRPRLIHDSQSRVKFYCCKTLRKAALTSEIIYHGKCESAVSKLCASFQYETINSRFTPGGVRLTGIRPASLFCILKQQKQSFPGDEKWSLD